MVEWVYVVTSGSYSDYEVDGIFSSWELAKKFIEENSHQYRDFNPICKMQVDPFVSQRYIGKKVFYVTMSRSGDSEIYPHNFWEGLGMKIEDYYDESSKKTEKILMAEIFADSEEHAVKIVNEYRIQMIARGEWPE